MAQSLNIQQRLAELTRQAASPLRRSTSGSLARSERALVADPATKLRHLNETQVFASLSPAEHAWLAENTTMITCARGRTFYSPDQPGEVVFILKRGKVDLYRLSPEGRKLVVATLGDHTIFGEMGLIGQGMYGCYAEATDDCLLCVLSRSDMQALIRRNPDVGLRLLDEMGRRLQAQQDNLESLAFRGLPARLASLLLGEADQYGTVIGLSHQDLADRLGTYRETVSQLVGRFRTEHLITVEPRRIKIIDPDGLRAYAES